MQLALLGWDDRFAAALAFRAPAGTFAGRVLQQYNHIYELMTETGEVRAQVAGRLRHQCAPEDLSVTGDWVAVRVPESPAVTSTAVCNGWSELHSPVML